ncbi:hypothetical protein HDU76_010924 [Blyttiomyces sp. JEL0837]|nr:hypothetical protein HDU76_010924 [Blyttiomyces sp. JEL0837]
MEEYGDLNAAWKKAIANFSSMAMAQKAVEVLNGKKITGLCDQPITAEMYFSCKFTVLNTIFNFIKSQVDDIVNDLAAKKTTPGIKQGSTSASTTAHVRVDIFPGDTITRVVMSSSDSGNLASGRHRFNQVLLGTVVKAADSQKKLWTPRFETVVGVRALKAVGEETGGLAFCDRKAQVVKVFAKDRGVVDTVVERVRRLVSEWDAMEKTMMISKEGLQAVFVCSLEGLKEMAAADDIRVDVAKKQLKVDGDHGVVERIRAAIKSIMDKRTNPTTGTHTSDEISCPVCFCEVAPTSSITLSCGHAYCVPCARHYASTFTGPFPMCCVAEKCGAKISFGDLNTLLTVPDRDALLETSWTTHVATHPDTYRVCSTVDCPGVFIKSVGQVQQCSVCLCTLCVLCGASDHAGLSCKDVAGLSVEDVGYYKWRLENGIKACPKCGTDIQKAEGCNHMKCIRCCVHFCWVCGGIFESNVIYEHMRVEHGGISG